ncbi:MAG: ammonium transporter [Actinomycetota bacterium]
MRAGKRLWIIAAIAVGLFVAAAPAFAADPTGATLGKDAAEHTAIGLNMLWLVLGAILVIFMQAGFALVETGFCRAKHAAHVVMTNFAIFGLGLIGYFALGYAFMFGATSVPSIGFLKPLGTMLGFGSHGGVIAHTGFFLGGGAYDVGVLGFFLYQVAFMDTTATIPTGSMAERWKFKSFVIWGLFCGALYYPLYGAWVWGGGWLSQLGAGSLKLGHGVVDFAGSGVVHAMGGVAALAGAMILGPRIGKFAKDGTPRAMPGHHIPMAMLGTLILLFGWFGFNAASTFAATDLRFAVVAVNTAIAGAFGATVAMFWVWKRVGKPDPSMAANGMLAGLVAITAPCAFVQPWAAAVIGSIAAVAVVESVWFVERKLKIDDPVGAISVHGVCGLFGVLAVGIFSDGAYGDGLNGVAGGVRGALYGDWGQLGAQAVAVLVLCTAMFGLAWTFFKITDKVVGLRSDADDELEGLDRPEMGVLAYPEFVPGELVAATNGGSHRTVVMVD